MKYFGLEILIFWIIFLPSSICLGQDKPLDEAAYQKFIQNHRAEKDSMFLGEHSPLSAERITQFQGLHYFSTNTKYRVEAYFEEIAKTKKLKVKNTKGEKEVFYKFGLLMFTIEDQTYELVAYKREQDLLFKHPMTRDILFVPFYDRSNGHETYKGGRYLDLKTPTFGQTIILDFNLAYNPYCVYNTVYVCPIPPVENTLDIAIPAGEKHYPQKNISKPTK